MSPSSEQNVTVVFVTLSLNNLGAEESDGIIISTAGFPYTGL